MNSDTIAAIATATSPSGIGIVRISGEDTLDIIDRIYRSKDGKKKISKCKSYTIHYGYIYDGDEVVDEVMVLLMKAPNSYTREDEFLPLSVPYVKFYLENHILFRVHRTTNSTR